MVENNQVIVFGLVSNEPSCPFELDVPTNYRLKRGDKVNCSITVFDILGTRYFKIKNISKINSDIPATQ